MRVIDLAKKSSPYLQTLDQFNQIDLRHFTIEKTAKILQSASYPTLALAENEIEIGQSGYHISRTKETDLEPSRAPDHLLRLYNYNKILSDLNSAYFEADTYDEGEILDVANSAFVVSPISSLVVLETNKDYDRFDIHENKDSLKNANLNSSGSVPEPHEWALIILALLVPLYLKFRS